LAEDGSAETVLLRWERQTQAALSLNHPHIRATYEVEDFEGRPGIVMEPLDGETLAERLARGPLPSQEALPIALQTARALAEAHAAGIAHGGLTTASIMLTKNGVKVMDFGLGSPENGAAADAASDVCALGRVLFEMLSGQPAPDVADIEDLTDLPPAIAPAITTFVVCCLARDPRARWPSVTEARTELERIAAQVLQPLPVPAARNLWPRFMAGVAVALAIGAGVYLLNDRRPQASSATRAIPFTTSEGQQTDPAFSPDGEKVAFSWVGPPRQDGRPAMNIYVKSILDGETVAVTTGPTVDMYPCWSPDGSRIAFQRTTEPGHALMIVPSAGGAAQKITDIGIGLTWSPDGNEIAYVSPVAPYGIVVRSLQSGAVRQITSPAPHWERLPAWSPDGKQIAFTRQLQNSVREIFLVPSQGGATRQLTFDSHVIDGIAWTPDSRELVFDSSRGSGNNLWRIPAAGGVPKPVAYTSNHPLSPAISLRGGRLAYSQSFEDTNIWQYERASPDAASFAQGRKCLICSVVEDNSPRFSPDGRSIVFASRRTGSEELWTANSDGSAAKQLTFLGDRTGSPRWSPDGRWIAFDSRAAGNPDIYVVSAQGGTPRRVTSEASSDIEPSWSHDGHWIYFISDRLASDRGGYGHIWKAPFEGGPALQVTQGPSGESLESADGKRLYYFGREYPEGIWSVPVEGGPEELVPELSAVARTRAWAVRAEGIYFFDDSAGKPLIRLFTFATRRLSTVLSPDRTTPHGNPGLDISPNGRKLLYTQTDRRVDGLIMVENFR
jgi:Tol biopolymer transport system component